MRDDGRCVWCGTPVHASATTCGDTHRKAWARLRRRLAELLSGTAQRVTGWAEGASPRAVRALRAQLEREVGKCRRAASLSARLVLAGLALAGWGDVAGWADVVLGVVHATPEERQAWAQAVTA